MKVYISHWNQHFPMVFIHGDVQVMAPSPWPRPRCSALAPDLKKSMAFDGDIYGIWWGFPRDCLWISYVIGFCRWFIGFFAANHWRWWFHRFQWEYEWDLMGIPAGCDEELISLIGFNGFSWWFSQKAHELAAITENWWLTEKWREEM